MEPLRPLGPFGQALWDRIWSQRNRPGEALLELVQIACEQMDERQGLRMVVLRDQLWRDRAALRALDEQIVRALTTIADRLPDDGDDDPADEWLRSLSATMGDSSGP